MVEAEKGGGGDRKGMEVKGIRSGKGWEGAKRHMKGWKGTGQEAGPVFWQEAGPVFWQS